MGEMAWKIIRTLFIVQAGVIFVTAITNLLHLLNNFVFGNVVGEVLGIISMCLPFDAGAVASGFNVVITAVLAFLVAQKIWRLKVTAVGQ